MLKFKITNKIKISKNIFFFFYKIENILVLVYLISLRILSHELSLKNNLKVL